ncbi:ImmA/IrrE family metallo-endopeptidase [Clostridium thermarum]|uniref:ImmA/IrrE family metallo-endopeptidase n=1 Tax=Clostridium thermarum TaxID=1716543 RepID=UPI0013D3C3E6|nr:ImmA/IrrE family metallo-endopeptidase [Clostridium thermarum]
MSIKGYNRRTWLYMRIGQKLKELGITYRDYPLNSIELLKSKFPDVILEITVFPSINMGGIFYRGKECSGIALNALRSEKGRNFDCMHEMIHYWYHPNSEAICFYSNFIKQNPGIEWEANEGAAYALMPPKLFAKKYFEFHGDIKALSDFFFVGETAVKYRIENLGLPKLERTKIITPAKQANKFSLLRKDPRRTLNEKARYCPVCRRLDIKPTESYCKFCGEEVLAPVLGYYGINYRDGVPLGYRNKALICPGCGNGNIGSSDHYCSICGAYLYQECTDPRCDYSPDSNARYCSRCGQVTTFFRDKHLMSWEEEAKHYIKEHCKSM